jgi:hypothetical protein
MQDSAAPQRKRQVSRTAPAGAAAPTNGVIRSPDESGRFEQNYRRRLRSCSNSGHDFTA